MADHEIRLYYSPEYPHQWIAEQGGEWYVIPHKDGGWNHKERIEKPADLDSVDIHHAQNVLAQVLEISGWGGARPGSGRKAKLNDPVTMSLQLERETKQRLEALAREGHISASELVRGWIEVALLGVEEQSDAG